MLAPLLPPQARAEQEIANLEEQMLVAINKTSTEELLGESEVYNMLVALQENSRSFKQKVARITESQRRMVEVKRSVQEVGVCLAGCHDLAGYHKGSLAR